MSDYEKTENVVTEGSGDVEEGMVVKLPDGVRTDYLTSKGKVKKICDSIKSELTSAYKEAPTFLEQEPDNTEIELSDNQLLGLGFARMTLDARRRALKRAELDPTEEFNKSKQIDDLESVIQDSVKLIAKGKYATKSEIEMMLARIAAAESGATIIQHPKPIDEAVLNVINNITSGNPTNRAFSFEEALNEARNAGFPI